MHRKQNPMPFSRELIRLQDVTLLLAVLVVAAFFVLRALSSDAANVRASVHLNGEEIQSIALHEDDHYRISLTEDYGVPVSFEVSGGAIRFVDVTCPDHICENTGFISADGQTAVCMPNRVAVVIVEVSQ